MKRWTLALVLTLLSLTWALWPEAKQPLTTTSSLQRPPRIFPSQPSRRPTLPQVIATQERTPAALPKLNPRLGSLDEVTIDRSLPIGKNAHVVEGVAGTRADLYDPSMGKKIHADGQFVFFRAQVNSPKTFPVALDKVNRQLLPVSSILHVKRADENLRQALLNEGLKEYYYQPKLQFLSLESTPMEVIKHYQDLKSRGYEVKLEVIKPGVKTN